MPSKLPGAPIGIASPLLPLSQLATRSRNAAAEPRTPPASSTLVAAGNPRLLFRFARAAVSATSTGAMGEYCAAATRSALGRMIEATGGRSLNVMMPDRAATTPGIALMVGKAVMIMPVVTRSSTLASSLSGTMSTRSPTFGVPSIS